MLYLFFLLLLLIPVLFGWGFGTVRLLHFLGLPNPHRFDVLEPFIGLATLALLVNLENFLLPVDRVFAVLVVVVGLILFLIRFWPIRASFYRPFWMGVILIWLAVISTYAVMRPMNFDSGLYHIPTIRWLVDAPVALGLANLHTRFGFNSSWFSVSALFAQSSLRSVANYTALASELMVGAFGIAVASALYRMVHNKGQKFSVIFLAASGLVLFAPIVSSYLSSPSTDNAILVLALVVCYAFLRAGDARSSSAFLYEFWVTSFLTLFAITIKLSVLPLALLPLSLFVLGYRSRLGLERVRNLVPVLFSAALVAGVWMARGFLLSGCLIYPIGLTCVPRVSWAVPDGLVRFEALFVQSWARAQHQLPGVVLSSNDWFVPWLIDLVGSIDFRVLLVCLVAGAGLCIFAVYKYSGLSINTSVMVLAGVSISGLGYWFLSAPDIRFGVTWFWVVAILLVSIALFTLVEKKPTARLWASGALGLLLIVAVLWVGSRGVGAALESGLSPMSLARMHPPLQSPEAVAHTNSQGYVFYTVSQDDRCYWVSMCTAKFLDDLILSRAGDNRLIFSLK